MRMPQPDQYMIKVRSSVVELLEQACAAAGGEDHGGEPYVADWTWTKRLQGLARGYLRLAGVKRKAAKKKR